jgi:hypothetical protein
MADGTFEYRGVRIIKDKAGRRVSLSRQGEIAIIDADGREHAVEDAHLAHAVDHDHADRQVPAAVGGERGGKEGGRRVSERASE